MDCKKYFSSKINHSGRTVGRILQPELGRVRDALGLYGKRLERVGNVLLEERANLVRKWPPSLEIDDKIEPTECGDLVLRGWLLLLNNHPRILIWVWVGKIEREFPPCNSTSDDVSSRNAKALHRSHSGIRTNSEIAGSRWVTIAARGRRRSNRKTINDERCAGSSTWQRWYRHEQCVATANRGTQKCRRSGCSA